MHDSRRRTTKMRTDSYLGISVVGKSLPPQDSHETKAVVGSCYHTCRSTSVIIGVAVNSVKNHNRSLFRGKIVDSGLCSG